MIRFNRLSLLVILTSAVVIMTTTVAGAVFAQENPNAGNGAAGNGAAGNGAGANSADGFLDYGASPELVVTASRTPEDATSAPAFVTVITAEQIAESGASSVVDVLETVPGVRFTGGMSGPGSESVSMRGFGENSFGRVLVLVDGKRLNNPDMQAINWNAIPLAAIERIEVLDGSASAQYGNSAVGGVISIITKKTGERRTAIETAGGSFFSSKASLSHFEPLPWGSFSLTAEHTGTDGYRERQGAQVTNLSGGAVIDLSGALRLSADASFADLYYQLPGGLTKEEYEDDPTQAKYTAYDENWNEVRVYNGGDEIAERHIGGGLGLEFFPNDTLRVTVPLSYLGKFIQSDAPSAFTPSYANRNTHTFEARPQVTAAFALSGVPFRLSGGVDFYYANLDNTTYGEKARETETLNVTVKETNAAPYLSARVDVLPVLFLSGGIRYDTVFFDVATDPKTVSDTKNDNALVWDAGIVFNPLASLKLYAKTGSLFRYPFTDEFASIYGTLYDSFNADLKPEKGFNAEAGVSFQLSKILETNANVYYLVMRDEVYFDGAANANMKDETRRIGANFGVKSEPVSFLEIEAGADWVNAVLLAGDEPAIPLVPAFTLRAALTGKLPFGLQCGPTLEYRGPSYEGGDTANDKEQIDGYFLLGLSARCVLGNGPARFAVQCSVKNLLDTKHTSNVYYSTYYPGNGRTVNVTLQYRF
ncbi:MAG: TonB-dependent receptor [Spirochaetaceae bacterium]|jgi:iron complex outermembrane receptor protein|nr:TonB-dependent receptor [Spirochaetaceae bacterium]